MFIDSVGTCSAGVAYIFLSTDFTSDQIYNVGNFTFNMQFLGKQFPVKGSITDMPSERVHLFHVWTINTHA